MPPPMAFMPPTEFCPLPRVPLLRRHTLRGIHFALEVEEPSFPVSSFAFHPELFEHRSLAIETLAAHGFEWFAHFSSVDLVHDQFGLEVCGIHQEADADAIIAILERIFPEWKHTDICYHEFERDRGWKAIIFKNRRRRKNSRLRDQASNRSHPISPIIAQHFGAGVTRPKG